MLTALVSLRGQKGFVFLNNEGSPRGLANLAEGNPRTYLGSLNFPSFAARAAISRLT